MSCTGFACLSKPTLSSSGAIVFWSVSCLHGTGDQLLAVRADRALLLEQSLTDGLGDDRLDRHLLDQERLGWRNLLGPPSCALRSS